MKLKRNWNEFWEDFYRGLRVLRKKNMISSLFETVLHGIIIKLVSFISIFGIWINN